MECAKFYLPIPVGPILLLNFSRKINFYTGSKHSDYKKLINQILRIDLIYTEILLILFGPSKQFRFTLRSFSEDSCQFKKTLIQLKQYKILVLNSILIFTTVTSDQKLSV